MSNSCTECKFCLLQDTGYSNYTVMGTDFHCLLSLHPEDGFDIFYELRDELLYAEKCNKFSAGDGIELDVDGERDADSQCEDQEVIDAYNNWDCE